MYHLMNDAKIKSSPLPPEPSGTSLTRQTARGFLWMAGQTVSSKIFSFVTQIALARILLPRDFGLAALAYTGVAFAGVIRQTGIQQILIQRRRHFRRWCKPAFWFELTIGIATALILAAASPAVAVVFHSQALIGLVLVIAAAAPLSPWIVVPTARLTIDMRFKAIAMVNTAYNLIVMATSIFLAWRGCGAYSFVLPLPIAGAVRAAWLWRLAKLRVGPNPQFKRWRFLAADSGFMLATGFVNSVTLQAGFLALGLLYNKAVVGQFFFAFNLSTQLAQILSQNLGSVLLPALSKLREDRPRHVAAVIRASRMLAFLSIPACLLLAAVAKPLVDLVYGAKWLPAAPALQLMALAMAVNIPNAAAYASLQSKGRFRTLFIYAVAQAPLFIAAVFIGARMGAAVGVAAAWALAVSIAAPVCIRLALGNEAGWGMVLKIYAGPIIASLSCLAPAMFLIWAWHPLAGQYPAQAGLATALLAVLYPLLGWVCCPAELGQIRSHLAAVATASWQRIGPKADG